MLSQVAERITHAAVAIKAASIMADPEKFCTGYWAKTDHGTSVSCSIATIPEYKILEQIQAGEIEGSERDAALAACDAEHWVEANSPAARQFCVEGACFKAAPTYAIGRQVIDGLNEITQRDFGNSSAQALNDIHRGIAGSEDEARQKLVRGLLSYADEQLNGGDEIDPGEAERLAEAFNSTVPEPEDEEPEIDYAPNPLEPSDGISLGS